MTFDPVTIAGVVISVLLMIVNFFMLHAIMHRVNARINSKDRNYNIVPIPGRN